MYGRIKSFFIGECISGLKSIHDQSRLTLLFNLAFAVTLMGAVSLIVSVIIHTYPVFIPAIGNLVFGLITLSLIKITGKFDLAAKFYFIVLFFLIYGNLNFNDGTMHVGAPFWIMLLNILVMYIIGVRWGIVFLVFSLLGYLYYLEYVFPHHMEIVDTLSLQTYMSAYYEAGFALLLLGFIIYTILKGSQSSDMLLTSKNDELKEQNKLALLREEEKTTMLKEIHHRVKNNLQVITSLLRLQMYETDSKAEAEKFKDSINRVMTMSLIHEKMYQSEELSRINLQDYFEGLSRDLLESYQTDVKVDLNIQLNLDKIGLKSIVPLALIFNELFSNSLKHAFDDTEKPQIYISLDHVDNDKYIFTYEDNGRWKANDRDKSFGIELISSLTSQLEGEMTFNSTPKSKYIFTFKHLNR